MSLKQYQPAAWTWEPSMNISQLRFSTVATIIWRASGDGRTIFDFSNTCERSAPHCSIAGQCVKLQAGYLYSQSESSVHAQEL